MVRKPWRGGLPGGPSLVREVRSQSGRVGAEQVGWAKARLSSQLARIHSVFPKAPLVVTSRIVGYREMGQRLRPGFEHLTVADLSQDDKDAFARRWCALTERLERREAATAELIRDIHGADRIEGLTGNPMLLATMALIERKIGRLPQRRVDLYEKAVEVLLNWRSVVDEPLDPREALPQLEYLAHALCADGRQQIREDELLERLRQARADYPNIHALKQHTPEEFLGLLENRTGLLIQSGHTRHDGLSIPVYEFRHLTFQEYLAGLALVQGHYGGWKRGRTVAQAIAPLAGQVGEERGEPAVVENWREALRLCVAACNDSEVEEVLAAILRSPPSSRQGMPGPSARDGLNKGMPGPSARDGNRHTERPRAVLAALCLADEPNVSEQLAGEVLRQLAAQVGKDDGWGDVRTSLDATVLEVARSRWAGLLDGCLLDAFLQWESAQRWNPGGLYGMARGVQVHGEVVELTQYLVEQAARLATSGEREAAGIALTVMHLAAKGRDCREPGMIPGLLQLLDDGAALVHAAAWALAWMNHKQHGRHIRHPAPTERDRLITAAKRTDCDSQALRSLSAIFWNERMAEAVDVLLIQLDGNHPASTRRAMVEALGEIGDPRATEPLAALQEDASEEERVRKAAEAALKKSANRPRCD